MRGVPLTPAEVARLVEVYERTGNYSTAGAALGLDPSVARRAILRRTESTRVELHARATARAIRASRRGMRASERLLARVLGDGAADPEGLGLEPRDIAALVGARARVLDALLATEAAVDRRRTGRATRDRTRAETELARARLRVLTDWDVVLAHATEPERAALDAIRRAAEARAARRADLAAEPEREPGGA